MTFAAPLLSKTSVNPPVDAPASRAVTPLTLISLKASSAPANLYPPLET